MMAAQKSFLQQGLPIVQADERLGLRLAGLGPEAKVRITTQDGLDEFHNNWLSKEIRHMLAEFKKHVRQRGFE
jgi:hypothetical protein